VSAGTLPLPAPVPRRGGEDETTALRHAGRVGMIATRGLPSHVGARVWKGVAIETVPGEAGMIVSRPRRLLSGEETIVILSHRLRRGDGGIARLCVRVRS